MPTTDEARLPVDTSGTEPTPIGQLPPLGEVPATMTASVIRQDRCGDPASAFQEEVVDTPRLGPDEVLVAVMAAGINYNNVWAARGYPVDQIAARGRRGGPEDFHIGGSDLSGIVYSVGDHVEGVSVGDHVIAHPGYWDGDDPWVLAGNDPMISPSARIWGYDTNYGAFGQFARLQAHQVLPKAPTSAGRKPLRRLWSAPPPTACCTASPETPSSPMTSSWSGVAPAVSDRRLPAGGGRRRPCDRGCLR